jgi:hypothetical protein
VGAELNPKVEKELHSEISEWGERGIYHPARCNNLAQHNLSNESCESLRTSKISEEITARKTTGGGLK